MYTSVEAYATCGKTIRVGKIEKIERIEYSKPLTGNQTYGKPYRVTFKVEETIRGKESDEVEIVLSCQHTTMLDFMQRNQSSILLVSSLNSIDHDPNPEVAIEEDGQRVDGYYYQFRFLDAPSRKKGPDENFVGQILTTYNSGRMFTTDLKVIKGKKAILSRLRDFAKTHPETGQSVFLRVPNRFGELVGYANAFCGIRLPVCPETEKTLISVLQKPELILNRIKKADPWDRNTLRASAIQCLEPFPSERNKEMIRKLVGDIAGPKDNDEIKYGSEDDVRRAGWLLLQKWGSEEKPR